jgi:hypothetical protein
LRLLKPPRPIAVAVMAAPATAAKTSIMAGGCYSSSLAQRIDDGESAVAVCGSVLGVENADEV